MQEQGNKVAAIVAKAIYQIVLSEEPYGIQTDLVYAHLEQYGMTQAQYELVIKHLIGLKALKQENYILVADKDVGTALGLV